MELLEKFAAVEVQADNCITETDRQFMQRQQTAYQDAVTDWGLVDRYVRPAKGRPV